MADDDRAPPHALGVSPRTAELYEALRAAPYAFDFFQALRRIESVHSELPRLGAATRAADDPLRLGQLPALIFAPSTLADFQPPSEGRPARLSTYFFGMFGPNGALPLHFTEYARERVRNASDETLVRFVDFFHHRMLSLYYRAWAMAQPTVGFDRPSEDRFATYVASLFGLGMSTLRDRDRMPDLAKLHFAGRLALQTRHAEGLRSIIADFTRLLPDGRSLSRLLPLVRNYIGDELSWDVMLVLIKEEVPAVKLGEAGMLGWTSWLGDRRSELDATDLVLEPKLDGA